MGKAITTLVILALVIAGGIWLFNRNGGDLARDGAATTTEDFSGIGGPEEDYDPLEGTDDVEMEESKG